jgi:hypothetical protein
LEGPTKQITFLTIGRGKNCCKQQVLGENVAQECTKTKETYKTKKTK